LSNYTLYKWWFKRNSLPARYVSKSSAATSKTTQFPSAVIVRPFTSLTFSSGKNLLKILYAKLTLHERASQTSWKGSYNWYLCRVYNETQTRMQNYNIMKNNPSFKLYWLKLNVYAVIYNHQGLAKVVGAQCVWVL